MSPNTIPYSSTRYNEILHLYPAGDLLIAKNGQDFIETTGRELLEKHGLVSTFGICLVHRHFELDEKEMLVEYNNISVPFVNAGYGTKKSDSVQPLAWLMTGKCGEWMPFEFGYQPMEDKKGIDLTDPAHADFLDEFEEEVRAAGLQDVVGLRKWPGDGFKGGLEFTEGRANIFMLYGTFSSKHAKSVTNACWYFEPEYLKAARFLGCVCKTGSNGVFHFHHVID